MVGPFFLSSATREADQVEVTSIVTRALDPEVSEAFRATIEPQRHAHARTRHRCDRRAGACSPISTRCASTAAMTSPSSPNGSPPTDSTNSASKNVALNRPARSAPKASDQENIVGPFAPNRGNVLRIGGLSNPRIGAIPAWARRRSDARCTPTETGM